MYPATFKHLQRNQQVWKDFRRADLRVLPTRCFHHRLQVPLHCWRHSLYKWHLTLLCSPSGPFQEGALTVHWNCVWSAGPLELFQAQLVAGLGTEMQSTLCCVDSEHHNGSGWAGLVLLQEVWSTPQMHSMAFGTTRAPAGRTGL